MRLGAASAAARIGGLRNSLQRRVAAALACLTVAAAVVALAAMPASAETLRWARASDATTLDPHAASTTANHNLFHQLYEPLLTRERDGSLQPALATAWEMDADPTVWRFTIRDGVRFHDGQLLSADDVVFSLNRARAASSDMKSWLATVAEVVKVDDRTITLRTYRVNPILPSYLVHVHILSAAWARTNHALLPQAPGRASSPYAETHENGTGPYRLISREPDRRTVLTRFDGYWGRAQFPFAVSDIIWLPIGNPATRTSALLAGEVDFLQDVPVQDVARLDRQSGVRVTRGAENRTVFFGFNLGEKSRHSGSAAKRNPLADRRVRQAFNLAIDRVNIVRAVMRGMGQATVFIVPPSVHGYAQALDVVPVPDPAAARALLAEAGYPAGFDLVMNCPNDRYINDEAVCVAVAGMLARIGVKAIVESRPSAVHFGTVLRREADFWLYGWNAPTLDSAYMLDSLYHSSDGAYGGANLTGYADEAIDASIESLSTADCARRDATLRSIWTRANQDLVYLPLHTQVLHYASTLRFDIPVDPFDILFIKQLGPPRAVLSAMP
jgi:peptide/nickel transport system substrate-binding protein